MKLHRQSVPVLGTSPISIDRAENLNKFSAMLDQLGNSVELNLLGVLQELGYHHRIFLRYLTSLEDVKGFVEKVGYPVLVRPSYVLSGAAMNVCYDDTARLLQVDNVEHTFVSKVLKRNFIETATRIMLDAPYTQPDKSAFDIDRIGVKASQFSFSRLHKADPVLGVDMSSTGEVGCIGDDFSEALLNAMIATGFRIPRPEKGVMFSSGAMKSKVDLLDASRMLFAKGYKIYATAGTAAFLNAHGVTTEAVYWPDERPDAENNVMTMIADHAFDLIVNIPKNHTKRELTNGYKIRRGAIDHNIPLITNARLASAFIEAFCEMKLEDIQIKSWQEYK